VNSIPYTDTFNQAAARQFVPLASSEFLPRNDFQEHNFKPFVAPVLPSNVKPEQVKEEQKNEGP